MTTGEIAGLSPQILEQFSSLHERAGAEDPLNNILLLTDSHKATQFCQYPPGTTKIYSYFECRGGQHKDICFFGLQYFIKRYLTGRVVTQDRIDDAARYFQAHFSHPLSGHDDDVFNRDIWTDILLRHNGVLPISIKAVPEGVVLPCKNVLFTIENTDPKCYWLPNYLETLLRQVWYPMTACTQSREMKRVIMRYLKKTGCQAAIDKGRHLFMLDDFGFRRAPSVESAALAGGGHLVNMRSTSNMAAVALCKAYYGELCAGNSVNAAKHGILGTCSREEQAAMKNILEQYPKGLVACISDSYDIHDACDKHLSPEDRAAIERREGMVVFRPDPGDIPATIVRALNMLDGTFGHTLSSTGHKLLQTCIRVMQADGIGIDTLNTILSAMDKAGWSAENLVFGCGGYSLQQLDRDTQRCAFHCSYAIVKGKGADVTKDPGPDGGEKAKKGLLTLECNEGVWTTVTQGRGDPKCDHLVEVFRNGMLLVDHTFTAVRRRADRVFGQGVPKSQSTTPRRIKQPNETYGSLTNILTFTDRHKVVNHLQYPPGTTAVCSYFEGRKGVFDEVCFFGLQAFLKKYMVGQVVTAEKIDDAESYFKACGPHASSFDRQAWEYILGAHGGHLPIRCKAVPEGTVVPCKRVLFTLENTDPQCCWLTSYVEALLMQVWYPTAVCTYGREQKKVLTRYMRETGSGNDAADSFHLPFKLHDFCFQGSSSVEAAAIAGCAHLVNFLGTDTLPALALAHRCYGEAASGFSIPATDSNTVTPWGREKECDAIKNFLQQQPKGVVACVSDAHDIFNHCDPHLVDLVEQRDGFLEFRLGGHDLPAAVLQMLEKLDGKFGHIKTTGTGHKLLKFCVRVVPGSGVSTETLDSTMKAVKAAGWCTSNLAFGSSSGLPQNFQDNIEQCMFKCSYAMLDTNATKQQKSKKSNLSLQGLKNGAWGTITGGKGLLDLDHLAEVYCDGALVVDHKLSEIRRRAEKGIR